VAILEADVVSYSRLMATHEDSTVRTVTRYQGAFVQHIREQRGRVIDTSGDAVLAELASALEAVRCALAVQEDLLERNASVPPERAVRFRIGIDLGDVRVEGERIYGSGVNVAARLEALAPPGGLCISAPVHEQVRYQIGRPFQDLDERRLKNIPHPVRAYALALDGRPPRSRRVGPRAIAAVAGAALLAIAAAAYLTLRKRILARDEAPLTSIAVLPFDDMSPGGDQKWLADGMPEELIETLSRIEALRVPARTSAFAMRGKDVATAGTELRVGSVVEGSVRRLDDQLRVTAQLIRVSDGSHLWSARYDRKLSDVFAIQSEIARAIAEAVRVELGIVRDVEWHRSDEPSDVRAYELMKRGFDEVWPLFPEEGLRKAIDYHERRWRSIQTTSRRAPSSASSTGIAGVCTAEQRQSWRCRGLRRNERLPRTPPMDLPTC
jgi:adenylate cyclase